MFPQAGSGMEHYMKMFLISDNVDTLTGMRLAGIPGVVVHRKDELMRAFDEALADKEIGIDRKSVV